MDPITTAPSSLRTRLYISHAFSYWGDRMWEFTSIVFIMELYKNTLLPSALFGIAENIMCIVLAPSFGSWIDRKERLTAVRILLAVQNIASILGVGAFAFLYYLLHTQHKSVHSWQFTAVYGVAVFIGGIVRVAFTSTNVAVEKAWVKILAGNDKGVLLTMNARMRAIDLTCKTAAPIMSGLLSSFVSPLVSMLFIGGFNGVSGILEYILVVQIYDAWPPLRTLSKKEDSKEQRTIQDSTSEHPPSAEHNTDEGGCQETKPLLKPKTEKPEKPVTWAQNWGMYFSDPLFLASLAYTFLYMSVLNWGAMMTSYLKAEGHSDWILAVGRGTAALCGILGTFLYPLLTEYSSQAVVGLFSIWMFVAILFPVWAYFWLQEAGWGFHTFTYLVIALALSRNGLWTFDMCIVTLIQKSIPLKRLGGFSGCQGSGTSLFYLLSFGLPLYWHEIPDFKYPVFVSFAGVGAAALLYSLWFITYRTTVERNMEELEAQEAGEREKC